jgi:hypothetical protein
MKVTDIYKFIGDAHTFNYYMKTLLIRKPDMLFVSNYVDFDVGLFCQVYTIDREYNGCLNENILFNLGD